MELQEYQEKAITTKIYKDDVALPYVVLGLVGEAGELKEKVEKLVAGSAYQEVLDLMNKEIGDVMWYCAATCVEAGASLEEVCQLGDVTYPHTTLDCADFVLDRACNTAEVLKKALRDDYDLIKDGNKLNEDKREKILTNVGLIVGTLKVLCGTQFVNFDDVLEQNIEKLASRKERGKLEGSGDER